MENAGITRLEWPSGDEQSPEELYLELMKRVLTGLVRPQLFVPADIPPSVADAPEFQGLQPYLQQHNLAIVERVTRDMESRVDGVEWIPDGETMIGLYRLDNVQHCVREVVRDGIAGDLIETGVWRGGACIFMRACLKAFGDKEKTVWLADSFKGLPPPSADVYPADVGDLHSTYGQLAISREQVEENFKRYGMLDDRVRFLEGWFKDTLPNAPAERYSVIRLDGDMYESTMDALSALYHKLSVGGFAIIDDYLWHKPCAQAVEDFRSKHGITEPVVKVDRAGVFWRRER